MRESQFQAKLIEELKVLFPGCIVLKNDEQYLQGIPDLLILFGNRWAALECKTNPSAGYQPNQIYWLETMHAMSAAYSIWPSNKEEILDALQQSLRTRR